MTSKNITFGLALLLSTPLGVLAHGSHDEATVISADDIKWGYLNPLRGDKSPGAADLWGDRTKDTATGMLVRFNKGFSSPPHIHNISYRGVVIKGLLHNDDPSASRLWMPPMSFWTQPAGEDHITAAYDESNLIYLEIDSGPYLVKPSSELFSNGEFPINLHESNMVWQSKSAGTPHVEETLLWGSTEKGQLGGSLLRFSDSFNGQLKTRAQEFRAVVIAGTVNYKKKHDDVKSLSQGSYFDSSGIYAHSVSIEKGTVIYLRDNDKVVVAPNK